MKNDESSVLKECRELLIRYWMLGEWCMRWFQLILKGKLINSLREDKY